MTRPNDVGIGVCIIVRNTRGEVLLMKRAGAHAAGCWAGPGGWIDRSDKTLADVVRRELQEEVGLTLTKKPTSICATTEDHEDLNCRTVTLYYLVDRWTGEPKILEPNKCSEIGWFSFHHLPQPLFPGLEAVLKDLYIDEEMA